MRFTYHRVDGDNNPEASDAEEVEGAHHLS